MTALTSIAFYLGVIFYSAAATLFFLELARRDGAPTRSAWGPRLLAVGAVLHGAHVISASLLTRVCPVESLHFALSLSALVAVVAYLALHRRSRLYAMGAFVAPLGLTFLVGAQFVGRSVRDVLPFSRGLLMMHIASNVFGVGLFLLAGAAGAFYLVLERRLRKKKQLDSTSRLPPLDALDRSSHRLLLAGFPLLTFGVVTGALFTEQLGQLGTAELLRSLLGYATWILLASVLVLRRVGGFGGRRAAYGTLAGVLCVLLVLLIYAVHPMGGRPS
ncbi:MAG TPA: cytochrome c biogenesis protein CcsA [Polyangiaceae bacterium]|nr:cytochrome c biogenesis protein CcsA [Polyangiaceae bacterium]